MDIFGLSRREEVAARLREIADMLSQFEFEVEMEW